jgi:hypothetical protein
VAGRLGASPKARIYLNHYRFIDEASMPIPGHRSGSASSPIDPAPENTNAPRAHSNGAASTTSISAELACLKALFNRHYYFSDDDVIDVVLGVVAGNHIDSDPIWLHLISPPSGGKTELLYSLFQCEETYFLSDLSANALISGYKDPPQEKGGAVSSAANGHNEPAPNESAHPDYSLLPKLNGKVVVTKDFSIIHDKPSETRSQILSILRDAFDGYASRALGNSVPKGYHSKFNYLTGMTPDIEKSWSLNTLGERFLMYRIRIADRREHARRALQNVCNAGKGATAIRQELQMAVKGFINGLVRTTPEVAGAMQETIVDLAELLSTCRTYVYRDHNDDIPCLPQAELASRVAKQLMRVGQSAALVRGKDTVTETEFNIMKRIALDSLPTNRRHLLSALWDNSNGAEPLEVFAKKLSRLSKNSVRKELENLGQLGAVRRLSVGNQNHYCLAQKFKAYCRNIGGIPTT